MCLISIDIPTPSRTPELCKHNVNVLHHDCEDCLAAMFPDLYAEHDDAFDPRSTCEHGVDAMACCYGLCQLCNDKIEAEIEACVADGGHFIVDDSTADGDSGTMSGHCVRCGYSFHHNLY